MKIKKFHDFIIEAAGAVKIASDEKSITIPKKLNDLIKEAKIKNDKVAELAAQLKIANKEKELFDDAVMKKLEEMKATSIRVGKIFAFLESKKGKESTSWKTVADLLLKKIFELDKKAATAATAMIEGMKKPAEITNSVKYEGPVIEESLSSVWKKIKTWFTDWKNYFLESADDYTDAADELEDLMSHHYDYGV